MKFLDRVLAEKADEIAVKRRNCSQETLEHSGAAYVVRDFRAAIAGGGRIIAEIKRKSPRVTSFRQQGPPENLARIYAQNGAAALSIVTDEPRFGSSLADVGRVRRVTPLPVLVKDFIIDAYQVSEARAAGADAVLLIARILTREDLACLLTHTHHLDMTALVECHDEDDLDKALAAGAEIIGINNRDLDTLEVSLETTHRLAPLIPATVCRVCESGIDDRRDIEALNPLGLDAFLIGGSLLNADDPGEKLRQLRGEDDG